MKYPKYAHSFEVVSILPEPLRDLRRLALNFRWTWQSETQALFQEMDKALWSQVEHNPIQLMNKIGRERLKRLASDASFLAQLGGCAAELDGYLSAESWFDRTFPEKRAETTVAYFCAEFGVSESLPIYSGGLGVLAGDHLKAASDLGLPLVGVGLLYGRGYFRQMLSPDGWQQEHYPEYDFYQHPLHLVRGEDQQPLRVEVEFPDRTIVCQIWKAEVGRIPLYLLDSNVLENAPSDQEITDTLYGGDQEMRIRQELILGVGGMRALRALGLDPTVCHMNEGHSAFLTLERTRQFMESYECEYRVARKVVVSGNVFTTHTPVPAGFDVFEPELLKKYAAKLLASVGLSFDDFMKLGRLEPENTEEAFNMAVLAMDNSNYLNGVSKLHASVTRRMFHLKWPSYPEDEVPIESITNGVHTFSWVSHRMEELFDQYLGPAWRESPSDPASWKAAWNIPDAELWEVRQNLRGDLIRFARRRLQRDLERRGMSRSEIGEVESILDPRTLTVGFARRYATYKRATLLLSDKDRLKGLLHHPERPVQFILAGKSHPRDDGGKKLIQDLAHFIQHEGAKTRMVFLEDYDIVVARALVQGVDVWLNNPRRPMEASGTSGMKVVPNGGLNCSVLDGWWDEGYSPGVGWAIGDAREYADPDYQDWMDSRSLYQVLEGDIAHKFYNRSNGNPPSSWVEMMKRSIAELAPRFSTARMVEEYATKFYMPASEGWKSFAVKDLKRAKSALAWRDRVRTEWPSVRILEVSDTAEARNVVGFTLRVKARIELGAIRPDEVRVHALVGKVGANRELQDSELCELAILSSAGSVHEFEGCMECTQPGHRGYSVRVVPSHADVRIPVELKLTAWEAQ